VWKVAPFVVALVVCLYMLDCFAFVRHNEMGVVTKCGAFKNVVQPGFHIKLPRPFTRIIRYPVKQVRRITIGFEEFDSKEDMKKGMESPEMEEKMGDPTGRVVVWSKQHFKHEDHYLTAARSGTIDIAGEDKADDTDETGLRKDDDESVPVIDYLSASIAVYYKIREDDEGVGLKSYYLNYRNPERILKTIIKKELISFFASADLMDVICKGNEAAQRELFERIRVRVNDQTSSLGVDVVNFAMIGVHPPVEVAESFQSIVTALQEKKKLEHAAWSDYHKMVESAKGNAAKLVADAEAYRFEKKTLPETEIVQFEAMLASFEQAPDVFKMRLYLDAIEGVAASDEIWKYLIATDKVKLVSEFTHKEPIPTLETMDPEAEDD
jgi:regulator of protease activity HflC (stomatin/prohibitin superfamily)